MKETNFVGRDPELEKNGEKKKLSEIAAEIYDSKSFKQEQWKEFEHEKTQDDIRTISLLDRYINGIEREFGIKESQTTAQEVHFIKRELWNELLKKTGENPPENASGYYSDRHKAVFVKIPGLENPSYILLACHEMIHSHSYRAVQMVDTEKGYTLVPQRTGLLMHGNSAGLPEIDFKKYFFPLNEAVTEEIIIRIFEKIKNDPADGKLMEKMSYDPKEKMFSEKIVGRDPNNFVEIKGGHYIEDVKAFDLLAEKLFQKNPDGYGDPKDIKDLFIKGYLGGNMLEPARLIEKTFGNGTFRKIGETKTGEEFLKLIESL